MTAIHTHSKILKSTHFQWRFDSFMTTYLAPYDDLTEGQTKKECGGKKMSSPFWFLKYEVVEISNLRLGCRCNDKTKIKTNLLQLDWLFYDLKIFDKADKKNVVSKDESKNYHGSFLILEIWGWDSRFEIGLQVLWQNVLCLPDSIVLLTFQAAIAAI